MFLAFDDLGHYNLQMSQTSVLGICLFLFWTLTNIGMIFDKNQWAWLSEGIRAMTFLMLYVKFSVWVSIFLPLVPLLFTNELISKLIHRLFLLERVQNTLSDIGGKLLCFIDYCDGISNTKRFERHQKHKERINFVLDNKLQLLLKRTMYVTYKIPLSLGFTLKYFEYSRAATSIYLLAAAVQLPTNQLTLDYAIFDSSSFVKGNSHTREIERKRRRGVFWSRSINLNGLYSSSSISAHAESFQRINR